MPHGQLEDGAWRCRCGAGPFAREANFTFHEDRCDVAKQRSAATQTVAKKRKAAQPDGTSALKRLRATVFGRSESSKRGTRAADATKSKTSVPEVAEALVRHFVSFLVVHIRVLNIEFSPDYLIELNVFRSSRWQRK